MSRPNFSSHLSSGTLGFLAQDSGPSNSLCADDHDDHHDLQKVSTLIEPFLKAKSRCQVAPFYVQAITAGSTTFLTTNLAKPQQELRVSSAASSWLVGRSSACAIAILEPTVSRCHAVIGHYSGTEFYIMDMGSSNGTRVNRRRLAQLERQPLKDGDLIEFGCIRVEFFVAYSQKTRSSTALPKIDVTYH